MASEDINLQTELMAESLFQAMKHGKIDIGHIDSSMIEKCVGNSNMGELVNWMHTGSKFFWIEVDAGLCDPDYIYKNKKIMPSFKIPNINDVKYKEINRKLCKEKKRFFVTSKCIQINTYSIADFVHIHLNLNHFKTRKEAHEWLLNRRSNILIQQQAKKYKLYLQQEFHQMLMRYNSRKYINKTYILYIHVVTDIDSPQLWRRIKINGRMTLGQFDEIIRMCLGFGAGKNYEFRFNLKYNKDIIKEAPNKYITKELRMTNDKIWNHFDRMTLRLSKDGAITMNIQQILMGQILSLLTVNFHKTKGKVPMDVFMNKYYKNNYFKWYKKYCSQYEYIMDDNLRKNNFNYDLQDTFQWIYDLGNDWRCNIYLEDIDDDSVTKKKWVQYMSGSGIMPPDNLGDFEDWKHMLLKCMNLYKPSINGLETAKHFYEWQNKGEAGNIFTDCNYMQLWMIKNGWNTTIYPDWIINNKFPLFKPYNLNIGYFFRSEMMERSAMCKIQNKKMKMMRLRSNIRRNKFCKHCGSMIGKLKTCKKCKSVFFCSRRCQKFSWNKSHRLVCCPSVNSI